MGLTIITNAKATLEIIKNQLNNLIGDKIDIKGFHLDGNIKKNIKDDLVLISSKSIYKEAKAFLSPDCPYIIARRSINYHEISEVFEIQAGSKVLLVNDLKDTAYETISLLKALGIDFIEFYPYYPGIKEYPKLNIAITPGEEKFVPNCVDKIINIQIRNIDFTTLVEILIKFNLLDEKANILSARYVLDIINLIKKKKQMTDVNKKVSNQFQIIINSVNDGIIAFDENKNISVFNPVAEKIFDISQENIIEENLKNENAINELRKILDKSDLEKDEFVKIGDKDIIIKQCIMEDKGVKKGTIYTLKDVTEIQRLEEELRKKLVSYEYLAKYKFSSIEGNSEVIKKTKIQAIKIANSNSPILIQGESGTGKELFAQAIHNESPRKRGPFVAINFAALPDSLIESELFGYEEGAFTGAKKGGMRGLFEQAHGGTIFLDEIGDAPISFQIRLLRVIQEKQVRRIGGTKVIPVDVRIISATNKDLKQLIGEEKFREDLYYRLNVLPLKVPPLRERKGDVMLLANSFYNYFCPKSKYKDSQFFSKIKESLDIYNWPGNIRELRNVVEYLVSIVDEGIPDLMDLPDEIRFNGIDEIIKLNENCELEILAEIYRANKNNQPIGRRSISQKLSLPENRIRDTIKVLNEDDLIEIHRGIRGIEITQKGIEKILLMGKRDVMGN